MWKQTLCSLPFRWIETYFRDIFYYLKNDVIFSNLPFDVYRLFYVHYYNELFFVFCLVNRCQTVPCILSLSCFAPYKTLFCKQQVCILPLDFSNFNFFARNSFKLGCVQLSSDYLRTLWIFYQIFDENSLVLSIGISLQTKRTV